MVGADSTRLDGCQVSLRRFWHQPFNKMKDSREYKEYMASDEWKRIRKDTVAQANGICDECHWPLGNSVPHAHHESYENFRHEGFDDVKALHSVCHKRKHPGMEEVKEDD